MSHLTLFDNLFRDFQYAARSLWRNPGFAALAVLITALGIGAHTAVFNVVNAVTACRSSLMQSRWPYRDADRIGTLSTLWRKTGADQPAFPCRTTTTGMTKTRVLKQWHISRPEIRP